MFKLVIAIVMSFSLFSVAQGQEPESYPITVDCSKTIDEMVSEGRYAHAFSYLATREFPKPCRDGKRDVYLIEFTQDHSLLAVLITIENSGFQSASVYDLLALGSQYPTLQEQFPIVSTSAVWVESMSDSSSSVYVVELWRNQNGRYLAPRSISNIGAVIYRYAVVSKSQ